MKREKPTPDEIAFDITEVHHTKKGDLTLPRLMPEAGSIPETEPTSEAEPIMSASKSESEEVPTISAMAAWDDFRMEMEQSEGLGPTIEMMQHYINQIKNNIDKNNLLMHLEAMEHPGSMEYNGVMRKIQKPDRQISDKQDIAKKFLRIYKRIITQRIHELESR